MEEIKVLLEMGYDERVDEMEDLFLELHKKCETMTDLTEQEQGMFDLLMWLYHGEDKPTVQ